MTAVEWLWQITHEREIDKFDWEKAIEMEKQQMATNSSQLEISDEEIENMAKAYHDYHMNKVSDKYTFTFACKWYREQLKQTK